MKSVDVGSSVLTIKKGDITVEDTDAIVNAANSSLMGGGGVDGAIHRAGGPEILEQCVEIVKRQGRLPAGRAVITTGGKLKARYVIHTVGPIWHGGSNSEPEMLRSCYVNSLKLAVDNNLKAISFPSISTGAYGYPVNEASCIAIRAIVDFLNENVGIKEARMVLFDDFTYDIYLVALSEIIGLPIE
ncbi:MAG: O-acetyl-ADP-ribose deacetylase [Actinobacteria bacterium]|nr:O-acetyl-ADP-ribose deacetylase [Actinomycetota bacterium]